MINKVRFPDRDSKQEGLEDLLRQTEIWVKSRPMRKLLEIYEPGAAAWSTEPFRKYLSAVRDLAAKEWNYRAGKERFGIKDGPFETGHRKELSELIEELLVPGTEKMLDQELTEYTDMDWIVILGGGAGTNRNRTLLSKRFYDNCVLKNKDVKVIGLSAERELSENEEHPSGQRTEFDSLTDAIESIYALDPTTRTAPDESIRDNFDFLMEYNPDMRDWGGANLIASWHDINWRCNLNISSLSAPPTPDPDDPAKKRRANTIDTIRHFLSQRNVKAGSKILLISSSRYRIPTICRIYKDIIYDRILEKSFRFFFTGNVGPISPNENIRSYLQEIYSSILEIDKLSVFAFHRQ